MSGNDIVEERLNIRAVSKANGITSLIIGASGVVVSLLVIAWMPEILRLAGIFLLSGSLVAILIGWFKLREPTFSVVLTPQTITYYHRVGQWHIDWQNVQRIDTPRITRGGTLADLELVGVRLVHYEPFLDSLTPRLATHLLMEQRPLLLQGERCTSSGCYSASLVEKDSYKLPSGRVLTGIKAMFAHRMQALRATLGYDVFLASAELDRSKEEFVSLLKQCQDQARQRHLIQ